MSELTPKDKAYIRLKCLSLVVDAGSRIDCKDPAAKAQEYYCYITGEKPVYEKVITPKKKPGRPPKKKEKDTSPVTKIHENVPFAESGRQRVIL